MSSITLPSLSQVKKLPLVERRDFYILLGQYGRLLYPTRKWSVKENREAFLKSMKACQESAKKNGLTPKIFREILKEDEKSI